MGESVAWLITGVVWCSGPTTREAQRGLEILLPIGSMLRMLTTALA